MSVNMAETIIARSDQLNAMDLSGGPRIINITRVVRNRSDDQPISIHYDGDGGKPYKPSKGMRRALVFVWGEEGEDYVGRSLELFLAPEVTWGGEPIGGIRISRASHINSDVTFPLQISKAKRTLYTVEPLRVEQRQQDRQRVPLSEHVDRYVAAVEAADSLETLSAVQQGEGARKVRAAVEKSGDKDLLERMTTAGTKRASELRPPVEEDEVEPDGSAEDGADYGDDLDDDSPFADDDPIDD